MTVNLTAFIRSFPDFDMRLLKTGIPYPYPVWE